MGQYGPESTAVDIFADVGRWVVVEFRGFISSSHLASHPFNLAVPRDLGAPSQAHPC